jgi:predicted nucleic acid-binding protein
MSENITSILNTLKELSIATCFNVFVPSLNQELTFKQLNTEQLKMLLETIADTATVTNKFNLTFYNVLKENLLSTEINIDNLTLYDAQYMALQIRANCLSNILTIYFTDEEIETYQLLNDMYELNIKDFINSKQISTTPEEIIIDGNISITCSIPTLKDENTYIKHFSDNFANLLNQEVQNVVGEIFIYEIVKSVKDITTNDIKTDLSNVSLTDKVSIIKQLPVSITSKIISYIEKYKQTLYDLYLVTLEVQAQDQPITLQKELQYNAAIFNY